MGEGGGGESLLVACGDAIGWVPSTVLKKVRGLAILTLYKHKYTQILKLSKHESNN